MMRILYVLAVGLTLAGLVHITTLFGVPWMSPHGAYDRLEVLQADGRFVVLPDEGDGADVLPFRDPAFVVAACRYDLGAGAVTVRAVLPPSYGALAVYNRYAQPYYALTDRAATEGAVEVTILDAAEAAGAELEEAPEGRPALRIVSPTPTGFVLVRLFAPTPSARPALREIAAKATCERAASRKLNS
jgi:uncharacterized membrane protein